MMVPVLLVLVTVVGLALRFGAEVLLEKAWRWLPKRVGLRC